jgi:CubicO group peptidase (beta-lactamase class C family)
MQDIDASSRGDFRFRDPSQPAAPFIPRRDWDRPPWNRWTFQHVRDMVPTTRVWRGQGPASPLPSALQEIDGIEFAIDGEHHKIGDYLRLGYVDGFLVLHRGKVVAECYLNGMTDRTLHLSQSVAKSITGTVAGILIHRGLVDPALPVTHYLPELEATAYRGATLQHVLDMTSGVVFDETYDAPDSHMAQMDVACGWKENLHPGWPKSVWQVILTLSEAECAHGASFRYRSIETDVLAFALQRASGLSIAELVSQTLWSPIGAEEDASFTVDPSGYGLADGGFNATLRDYARFALLHLGRGDIDGRRIVPSAWLDETRFGARHDLFGGIYHQVLPKGAYHNQFWIEDDMRRAYMARGVFGQFIFIDPEAEFAAVQLASWPEFVNPRRSRMTLAAIRAIRDAIAEGSAGPTAAP